MLKLIECQFILSYGHDWELVKNNGKNVMRE